MGDSHDVSHDLAQSVRLGLQSHADGMRLFAARLVRKYRLSAPELSRQIDQYLQAAPAASPMRRKSITQASDAGAVSADPSSAEGLALRLPDPGCARAPLLSNHVAAAVQQLLTERRNIKKLAARGLEPIKSAIFIGPPGVGKTMTAKWIASELSLPLLVLDLATIMSSFLGGTGANLRAVLDHAKATPSVLLLDEIDAIAKRRGDLSDVGELKRLVTVILQEVDAWPSSGLLLAATNHPELIDPALWRRFDLTLEFPRPDKRAVAQMIERLLAGEAQQFALWIPILALLFQGSSHGEIERTIRHFRKAVTLGSASPVELVEDYARQYAVPLEKAARQDLARKLASTTNLSQHKISDITGVSRDTIRKHQKQELGGHGD